MTDTIRFFIVLFAIMFFWVYTTPAFAKSMSCWTSSAGVTECITSDGEIVKIG